MRVLVTGAGGFIGSHVVRALLADGYELAALVRPGAPQHRLLDVLGNVTLVEADLDHPSPLRQVLEKLQPDACIHLAWYVEPADYLHSTRNVAALGSTLNLFEELLRAGCRHIVGAGTCAEYDMRHPPLREDGPVAPRSLYAAVKLAACVGGQQMAAKAGARFAWARLFYLYGPGEDESRLVAAFIRTMEAGEPFAATPGGQVRDYLHVSDVAAAFAALIRAQVEGIFNIASGVPVTVRDVLATAGELLGRRDLITFGAIPYRPGDPMVVYGDNSRLRALGWAPAYSLRDGLSDTIASWRRASCR